MTSQTFKRMGRRIALVGAMAALMAGFTAGAASAEVVVLPEEPLAAEQTVGVVGTPSNAEATFVAIALCNNSVEPGTRCDGEKAVPGLKTKAELAEGVELVVRKGPWVDWDFTKGKPQKLTSETTCEGAPALDPCAVFVSHYKKVMGVTVPLFTSDIVPVVFE